MIKIGSCQTAMIFNWLVGKSIIIGSCQEMIMTAWPGSDDHDRLLSTYIREMIRIRWPTRNKNDRLKSIIDYYWLAEQECF